MKKLLPFLVLFACFYTHAQTVAQAQLQGSWRMAGFTDENGSADVIAGTWTLNDPKGENNKMFDGVYEEVIKKGRETIVTIKGNTATQNINGEVQEDTYTLEDKDGKTYMSINDGMGGVYLLLFKNGRLHYCVEELKMEFVYNKVE